MATSDTHKGENWKGYIHGNRNDTWLTPPGLVRLLGPFTTDPCCPPTMPWSTAKYMYTQEDDGLVQKWRGRVWLNPPYSNVAPWAEKFVEHGSGFMLVSAKSTDTRWCQLLLRGCDSAVWFAKRMKFYRTDGTQSTGAFLSNMLFAASPADTVRVGKMLLRSEDYVGVHMRRV